MPSVDSFQSRRAKASGEETAICKPSNVLLFVLVGFVMFYIAVGLHIYIGSAGMAINSIVDEVGLPDKSGQDVVEMHLRGATVEANAQTVSTVAEDGIDDAVTAVVLCTTSQGNLTVDVRGYWSPLGAEQYLKLVEENLFTDLPFFRVCPRYITQFGPKYMVKHYSSIRDDPPLWGVRDMDFGYVFFAGGGAHTRGSQMVVALCEKPGCIQTTLGKAPWEVPLGTIRKEGFETLRRIGKSGFPYPKLEMAGQADNAAGPDQHRIVTEQNYLKEHYPTIEYWHKCEIEQRNIHIARPL